MSRPRLPRRKHLRIYAGTRQRVGYVVRRLLGLGTPSADLLDAVDPAKFAKAFEAGRAAALARSADMPKD